MKTELKEKTKEWMSLERKTLKQRQEAELFYESHLMKLVEEDFVERNRELIFEQVEYLITSVGTSYEPIVLNICLLQPVKILFLCTERSETILGKVVGYCNIPPERYEKRLVNETDPMDIYREIKRAFLKWEKPERLYVDFTGGTKAMSAACALAGAMVDVQMVYVSTNDYLVDFRKPNPGSEELVYIENPIAVFGDMEMDKAMELFGKHNYAGAAGKLEAIKEKVPDPEIRQQLVFLHLLSRAYEAWDALDFPEAYQKMDMLYLYLKRDGKLHRDFILMDKTKQIRKQKELLRLLSHIPIMQKEGKKRGILEKKEIIHALMFTMYVNAITREKQEKYDMATLLFYRLLEMIGQRRLICYNLYASEAEYQSIRYCADRYPELKDKNDQERFDWLKERNYRSDTADQQDTFKGEGAAGEE